jgi:hypothetical protein
MADPTGSQRPTGRSERQLHGAIDYLRHEMANDEYVNALIDASELPRRLATRLEGTKNAVFAKYAFGVRR